MSKFTESKLEDTFIQLLAKEGYQYVPGEQINRSADDEVLIDEDLLRFLMKNYADDGLTTSEAQSILLRLKTLPASDLYESNKTFTRWIQDGFSFKREDPTQKDIWIYLIDYENSSNNDYKFVNQLEIIGAEKRIPDGIVYINGIPLVVFEFKSAIREEATIHNAYVQLTVRYRRDIPELFKYNAFCIISDGVNNKSGSFFAPYKFYYAWRRIAGSIKDAEGINSIFTMIEGMLDRCRLKDIIRNFVFIPDASKNDEKIVCRYPQYYGTRALFHAIKKAQRPDGDGKGGTYFGATGSGKSFVMVFLTRLLMKSPHFENPTVVLITDRTDLNDQLSARFASGKQFIGDYQIKSVTSRAELRELLQKRKSGGVFLTTIHKFTEDTRLLTKRNNVICISDEAHRSQVNLDQKIRVTGTGVEKSFGFAKYLHDSLPNAVYVGFTGTPIDKTLEVFGEVVDAYTMTESVEDEITVRIVYEGRAAKIALNNSELDKIEEYYKAAEESGANEYQIEKSKEQSASMNVILGDSDRLDALAADFIKHYETRVSEGATVAGKAMFVCSSREIAFDFYKRIIQLRPDWNKKRRTEKEVKLTEQEKRRLKPMEKVKLVMTRLKDDPKEMYELIGTKDYQKELTRQFKIDNSNFKIAIVVDMWLTGFDVPALDTMYIDKPLYQHNLIQTISRVNRNYKGKEKGLIVDYIGMKKQMNRAMATYTNDPSKKAEDTEEAVIVVRDHLNLLAKIFYRFDNSGYFEGNSMDQLNTLNRASEFIQQSKELETRFMDIVKRLRAAYDICSASGELTSTEKDRVHFYLAVRSIIFKLTKGDAPDTEQMNARVREMIQNALESEGVEEIIKLGESDEPELDLFDQDYLDRINKIKLPNTKIKLLQKLLARAIGELKQVNKVKGVDFSKKMKQLVDKYNDRSANDIFKSEVYDDMANQLTDMIWDVYNEFKSGDKLGIGFEVKAFYDILKALCIKYDFTYPEDKMMELAKAVKVLVDDQTKFPDWNKRQDIKSQLKVGLILLLDEHNYPPVERDEVYDEIFEQAENFKKYRSFG